MVVIQVVLVLFVILLEIFCNARYAKAAMDRSRTDGSGKAFFQIPPT